MSRLCISLLQFLLLSSKTSKIVHNIRESLIYIWYRSKYVILLIRAIIWWLNRCHLTLFEVDRIKTLFIFIVLSIFDLNFVHQGYITIFLIHTHGDFILCQYICTFCFIFSFSFSSPVHLTTFDASNLNSCIRTLCVRRQV